MAKKLLIVESPAKAKTIGKYLGGDFIVKSSVGHIRDLPKENGAIKIAEDGPGRWTFTPVYEVSDGKAKVVSELKSAVKTADEVLLASDPDREGIEVFHVFRHSKLNAYFAVFVYIFFCKGSACHQAKQKG